MDRVLVVKAIEPNFNTMGGPPVMMVGGGGGNSDRGRTLRERAGGVAGGLVGVAGALAGRHRSLGSLVQGMISGGAQGKALGGGLGRTFVGRTGQARANQREASRQQRAEDRAGDAEQLRNRGQGIGSRFNPAARLRRHNYDTNQREDRNADLVAIRNQGNDAGQRDLRQEYSRQGNEKRRINQSRSEAEARAAGAEHGTNMKEGYERDQQLRANFEAMGMSPENIESSMNRFTEGVKDGTLSGQRIDPPEGEQRTGSPKQLRSERPRLGMTAVTPSPPIQAKNAPSAPDLANLSAPSAPDLDTLHQQNLLDDMNGKVAVARKPTQGADSIAPLGANDMQPVMPIPPLATPPAGSVGSGNESADPQGAAFNNANGLDNFNTENEASDIPSPNLGGSPNDQEDPAGPARQSPPTLVGIQQRQARQQEEERVAPSHEALEPKPKPEEE